MFKQVRMHDAILKFYQRSQPIAFSNAETLYDDLVLLRDQILMYGDLSEAQTNYLNNFIDKFDTTLSTTVRDIFEKWLNDGFLVSVIRGIINEEVVEARDGESKLNIRLNRDKQDSETKINLLKEKDNHFADRLDSTDNDLHNINVNWINKNLGKLDQTFMDEEFLQQIAGDTPINTIPTEDSVVTSMIVDRAVTRTKTNFVEKAETKRGVYKTIRLLDFQNTGNDGKMLDEQGVGVQNQWTEDLTFTNHIPIEGGAEYAMTYRNCVVFDAGNNVIGFLDNSGYTSELESKRVRGLPDEATHIAITLATDRVATDTIEQISPLGEGDSIRIKNIKVNPLDTTFVRYGDQVERDYYESIKISKYTNSKNDGKVLGYNGIPVSSQHTTSFTYTNIIPIIAGATYALYFRNLVVFNVDGAVVDFVDNTGYHPTLFDKQEYTMPINASHIVISLDIDRATLDTIEKISPTESDKTIVIDNLQVSPSQTDFAYFPSEDGTVYEMIKVLSYKNSNNDGQVLSGAGVPQQTQYTTDLTYTEKIPVLSGGLYYVDSRSFVVFNEEQQVIGYFDNPGYSAVNSLKKEYRLPNNSKFVVLNVAIDQVNTVTMERLSPNDDERPIEIKNLKVPKADLKGKNILVLGDSINASYANNISDFIHKLTGANVLNGALGGARLSTKTGNSENAPTGSEVVKYLISGNFQVLEDHINNTRTGDLLIRQLATLDVLKSVNLNELDMVILAYGTNDRLESVPIGSDTDDETKFKGALKLSIQRLQSAYPQLQVMLASQPYSYQRSGAGAYHDENAPNLAGHVIGDYAKAMEEVANKYHVHFVDNYTNAGINEFNKGFYFNTFDGIHGKQETFIPLLAEKYIIKLSEIY